MLSSTLALLKEVCLVLKRKFSGNFAVKATGYFLLFWFALSPVDKKQTVFLRVLKQVDGAERVF